MEEENKKEFDGNKDEEEKEKKEENEDKEEEKNPIEEKEERIVRISEDREPVIENRNSQTAFDKIPKHNWAITTYILGILCILLLIPFLGAGGGLTGNVISQDEAGTVVVDFFNERTEGGVEFVSAQDMGNMYNVLISYQGEDIPMYVTKDGEYLIQGVLPLGEELPAGADTGVGATPQPPQDVPKSDKPVVEAFIMSHCPYGTQIEKGLIPVIKVLGDKADIQIKFVYYVMHGETEVMEQLNQYCIDKEQNDKFIDYLECFLEDGDGARCLTETGIDIAKLDSCTESADTEFDITKNLEDESSWLSGRFPLFNTHKEDNDKYSVGGSPTLVINGEQVSSARDSASLLSAVCNAFNTAPEECDAELSPASPSAGFGYDTAPAGTNYDAQCG